MAELSDAESVGGTLRSLKCGRPSTSGEYVGLVSAKAKKLALNREELRLQTERDVAEAVLEQRKLHMSRATVAILEMGSGPTEAALSSSNTLEESRVGELMEVTRGNLEVILMVATKSSNLKSTYVTRSGRHDRPPYPR